MNLNDINIDDLPQELRKELSTGRGRGRHTERRKHLILELIKEHGPLSKDELILGIWQSDKVITKRHSLSSTINVMLTKGILRRAGHGVYALEDTADGHTTH